MGRFVKGDIVVVPFPFSDLSSTKKRPAFVVAVLTGEDLILSMITSKQRSDVYSVSLSGADFASGGLRQDSFVRPNRLFTADASIVRYTAGRASPEKTEEIIAKLIAILNA